MRSVILGTRRGRGLARRRRAGRLKQRHDAAGHVGDGRSLPDTPASRPRRSAPAPARSGSSCRTTAAAADGGQLLVSASSRAVMPLHRQAGAHRDRPAPRAALPSSGSAHRFSGCICGSSWPYSSSGWRSGVRRSRQRRRRRQSGVGRRVVIAAMAGGALSPVGIGLLEPSRNSLSASSCSVRRSEGRGPLRRRRARPRARSRSANSRLRRRTQRDRRARRPRRVARAVAAARRA